MYGVRTQAATARANKKYSGTTVQVQQEEASSSSRYSGSTVVLVRRTMLAVEATVVVM